MEPVDLEHAGAGTKSSPQSKQNSGGNPQTSVHHRAPVESPAKSSAVTTSIPTRATAAFLPLLPAAPQPVGQPPAEAAHTSPPQQPQLKLVPSPSGIVLSWCVAETDLTCSTVDSYHLYAFHQDNSNTNSATQQHWKRIGEVKALPLPMACTLTQSQPGVTYHFAVRAKDMYGRFGSFCDPQCTNAILSPNSGIKGALEAILNSGGNPKTTVQHCAPVESPEKSCAVTTTAPTPATATVLPPLPTAIQPVGQLTYKTSPPQQLQLKVAPVPDHLKQQKPGEIVMSWWVAENDLTCATVVGYDLYAFRQDNPNANSATQKHWNRIGEVKALPLPMACTVAQVQCQASATYHFAIRAKDIYGRFGSFCDPQCTVIGSNPG